MDTFDCEGWLHITITEESNIALVKLKHQEDHVPYWDIDVPEDARNIVSKNPNLTMSQVSIQVLYVMYYAKHAAGSCGMKY